MFSLAKGKLIRLNSDDTDGEFYRTKSSKLTIGTSLASDCPVGDPSADPTAHLAYEICTDEFGRVSTAVFSVCEHDHLRMIFGRLTVNAPVTAQIIHCVNVRRHFVYATQNQFSVFPFRSIFIINVAHSCWSMASK